MFDRPEPYIGLMSGTSMDGVDGVLAVIDAQGRLAVKAHAFVAFGDEFKLALMALNQSGHNELHRSALAGIQLARCYADVVQALLAQTQLSAHEIKAIGAHGQTVRHHPQPTEHDACAMPSMTGYTLQLNNPALLAELTGMDVVADFRSRDLAAGGQGAPLVPAFHQGVFGQADACVAVLNIGGISNLSVLPPDGPVTGWDCGPGNALIDHWCAKHTGQAFDHDGAWAASGQLNAPLLTSLLDEAFIHSSPPKSTGRDLFNPSWLNQHLAPFAHLTPADVQASLTEFTVLVCVQDVRRFAAEASSLLVCGGGALNGHLMRRLAHHLPHIQVHSSQAKGLPPLQVEAAAFAWLAFKTMKRETGSLPSVTGARGARVLGAIYPR